MCKGASIHYNNFTYIETQLEDKYKFVNTYLKKDQVQNDNTHRYPEIPFGNWEWQIWDLILNINVFCEGGKNHIAPSQWGRSTIRPLAHRVALRQYEGWVDFHVGKTRICIFASPKALVSGFPIHMRGKFEFLFWLSKTTLKATVRVTDILFLALGKV